MDMAGAPYSKRQFFKILDANGYVFIRKKGSHMIYKNDAKDMIVVPFCSGEYNPLHIQYAIKRHSLKTNIF